MSSVEIIDTKFLDYDIRSCFIDNVEMFLVSDLIRQYNLINKTNKRFKDYLRNNDTKELLIAMNEEINEGVLVGENSPLLNFNNKNDKNKEMTDGENIHHQYKNDKNKEMTDGENIPHQYKNDKFNIPHVIKYIIFKNNNFGGVNKGYVVCEEFLIQCLMWVNKKFAIKVSKFLKNLRSIDNNRLNEIINSNEDKDNQIELLQDQVNQYKEENKHLKTRSTPDSMNYHFCVLHNTENNHVSTFISKKQYNPSNNNIKRVYDLVCPNPVAMYELTINLLSQHKRFEQIDSNEFITDMTEKGLSMQLKKLLKQVRENLNWITGLKI